MNIEDENTYMCTDCLQECQMIVVEAQHPGVYVDASSCCESAYDYIEDFVDNNRERIWDELQALRDANDDEVTKAYMRGYFKGLKEGQLEGEAKGCCTNNEFGASCECKEGEG